VRTHPGRQTRTANRRKWACRAPVPCTASRKPGSLPDRDRPARSFHRSASRPLGRPPRLGPSPLARQYPERCTGSSQRHTRSPGGTRRRGRTVSRSNRPSGHSDKPARGTTQPTLAAWPSMLPRGGVCSASLSLSGVAYGGSESSRFPAGSTHRVSARLHSKHGASPASCSQRAGGAQILEMMAVHELHFRLTGRGSAPLRRDQPTSQTAESRTLLPYAFARASFCGTGGDLTSGRRARRLAWLAGGHCEPASERGRREG
jgi:hypothetical protein